MLKKGLIKAEAITYDYVLRAEHSTCEVTTIRPGEDFDEVFLAVEITS